eukprot:scaffold256338_cov77-Attheya_sp.AAC.1
MFSLCSTANHYTAVTTLGATMMPLQTVTLMGTVGSSRAIVRHLCIADSLFNSKLTISRRGPFC